MTCDEHTHDKKSAAESCTAYTYQSAAVSVPITVRPKVSTGNISTFCCGEPSLTPSPFEISCSTKSGTCHFVLTQNICIEIPIEFSADACSGCPRIECGEVSSKMCEDCGG